MIAHTTFDAQIAQNKRRSIALLVVLLLILAVVGYLIGLAWLGSPTGALVMVPGALAVSLVLSVATWYGGDGIVLAASRAREVGDADAPQLRNVVRELSIAAGIPMPRTWIIEDSAPNAFATGRDPGHASVAITTGLLEKLDREELQGVIGHELSHIRNYDIRFALLVGVLVGGIALLCDVFLRSMWWGGGRRSSRSNDSSNGAALLFMVLAIVLAILAPFFARLVQMAVSRQREYLADASSVDLTRNPAGLERALGKIAADPEPLEVANRATQHLYIVNPIKKLDARSSSLFSTHPPLVARIDRLRQLSARPPLSANEIAHLGELS